LLPAGEALALPYPVRIIADIAELGADDRIIWCYPAPARALAALLADAPSAAEALARWRSTATALLATARPLRRRLTLVEIDAARAAGPVALAAALAGRPGLEETAEEIDFEWFSVPATDPLLHVLAAACLAADPLSRPLLAELEATALALPGADPAPPEAALATLRALRTDAAARADLELQTEAMEAEIVRLEAAAATARAEVSTLKTQLDQSLDGQARAEAALARAAEEAAALAAVRADLQDRLARAEAARAEAQAARQHAPAREAVLAAQILRLGRETERLRAAAEAQPDKPLHGKGGQDG
jgi:hypothetical protein